MAASLTMDNPVFRMFIGYAAVVLVKTVLMSPLTAVFRFKNQAFANPEDSKSLKVAVKTDSSVERVRRCHLNDLENVIPFVLIGLLYVCTGPTLSSAALHFRIFTGSRLFHSVAYLLPLPQPSRALGFFAGFLVCLSMAYNVIQQAAF